MLAATTAWHRGRGCVWWLWQLALRKWVAVLGEGGSSFLKSSLCDTIWGHTLACRRAEVPVNIHKHMHMLQYEVIHMILQSLSS